MTAIPEPTQEDLEFARDMLNSLEKRPEIALMEDFCSMWLVLAHYQRENERLRTRCEALEEHIGKTADGVCLHECESHYCPHCNNKIERGDSFTAYCDHCPNPDGGAYPAGPPLPMFWEQTLANPKEPAK